ncbi:hypothetical protein MVLG_02735 [Microbotryum lychnidis-dioicae p1A1 Lamole]|uniref:Uncharacterized protein n=1 Tax=Microbotryum lychnidis-dioicae (strain p1A1 Lamole / MvSl-1064) TaxID=683840 RepID=U5H630_USTV1|nr:hypothetical protein MVLG_02735 [Microbotryum lychnidis-dioicae p1A1 Lamole]|eukprot:KDE06999.1 hypothetical protein MVLG_02735 [Microbotryum lychnidis-dioicae p1A1 Lamole]
MSPAPPDDDHVFFTVTGCYSPRLFRDRAQSELFAQKYGGQVDSFRTRAEALLKLSTVGVSAGARRSTSKGSCNISSSQSNGRDAGAAEVQVYEDDLDDSETDMPVIVISTSD